MGSDLHSRLLSVIDVVDRAPALNAANGIPPGIIRAGHNSRLPLERTDNSFEDLCRVAKMYHRYESVREAYNKRLVARVETVYALAHVHCGHRLRAAQIPVFDRLIPRPRDEHLVTIHLDRPHTFDRLGMFCDLLCCRCTSPNIEHARGLVCAATEELSAILIKISNVL